SHTLARTAAPPTSTLFPCTTLFRSVFRSPSSGQSAQPEGPPTTDPRLQPTPDYGTLGPGADVGGEQSTPDPTRQAVNPKSYGPLDRKSTRLNSSHQIISYAVFWLKK